MPRSATSILFEEVEGGWRWTLRDLVGETQGWEPSWSAVTAQARHVHLVHRRSREQNDELLRTALEGSDAY